MIAIVRTPIIMGLLNSSNTTSPVSWSRRYIGVDAIVSEQKKRQVASVKRNREAERGLQSGRAAGSTKAQHHVESAEAGQPALDGRRLKGKRELRAVSESVSGVLYMVSQACEGAVSCVSCRRLKVFRSDVPSSDRTAPVDCPEHCQLAEIVHECALLTR